MAITKQLRQGLGVHLLDQEGLQTARVLPNGNLRTREAVIIQPSQFESTSMTGPLDELTPEEQKMCRTEELQRSIPPENNSYGPPARPAVKVVMTLPGVGELPAQYTHCYLGNGIVVLGLNEYSYIPAISRMDEAGNITGAMQLDRTGSARYVYNGYTFKDAGGIENIVLMEVPGERSSEPPSEEVMQIEREFAEIEAGLRTAEE